MNNLENRIIKQIYQIETKQTILEIFLRLGAMLASVTLGLIMFVMIINKLAQQQTLDLLQIFQEDIETIKAYIMDIAGIFYQEIPKSESMLLFLVLILFIILTLIFIKNSKRIGNKINSLRQYWMKN